MQRSNSLATVSLGTGVGAVLLMFVGYCAGVVPIVGPLLAFLLMPVEWILAFVALITGVLGYRTAPLADGAGRGSAIAGLSLSLVFFALQGTLMLLACFGVGALWVMDGM